MNKLATQAKILMDRSNKKLEESILTSLSYKELQAKILIEAAKGATHLRIYPYEITGIDSTVKQNLMIKLLKEEGFIINHFTGVRYKPGIYIEWGS